MLMTQKILLLGVCWGLSMSVCAAEDFPGRAQFPDVPVIEKAELKTKLQEVVVVDSRSKYEFDTLRIKGAVNIPIADANFEAQVKKLRSNNSKPIVFYCNGRSCLKSYHAVKRLADIGIKETYAFDAGVFEWIQAYPAEGELLGESPINLAHLIGTKNFETKLLDPETFGEKMVALGDKSMVLDIRDKYQRAGVGFFPGKERWVSLDKTEALLKFIDKAIKANQTVLIYDEVGKQVQWVQYTLEKAGLKNYFFMDKGAQEYYRVLAELQRKQ